MAADDIRISPKVARALISNALVGSGTSPANASYFTEAILDTELSGLDGHGFFWLQFYCEHLRTGKVDGKVKPKIKKLSRVAFRVDARFGFAHPAIELGFRELVPAAKKHGLAALAVQHSYNAATLGYHTGFLARQGLLALGFTNSVPAMAPVGGSKPVLGTNPMSLAVPGPRGKIAFLIDQSSAAVAWTAVKRATDEGRPIPLGWALDKNGKPTTDANEGLSGSMAPAGGYKGFSQGLIVEVMCAALTGSLRGLEMGSFTESDGKPIGCGQFFIAIEPEMFSGGAFARQVKALVKSITAQDGARLPNSRREANKKIRAEKGLPISQALYDRLKSYE